MFTICFTTSLPHLPTPPPSTRQRPGTRGGTRGSRDSAPCAARTSAAWAAAPQAPDGWLWAMMYLSSLGVSKRHPESSLVPIFLDETHWSSQAAGWSAEVRHDYVDPKKECAAALCGTVRKSAKFASSQKRCKVSHHSSPGLFSNSRN